MGDVIDFISGQVVTPPAAETSDLVARFCEDDRLIELTTGVEALLSAQDEGRFMEYLQDLIDQSEGWRKFLSQPST